MLPPALPPVPEIPEYSSYCWPLTSQNLYLYVATNKEGLRSYESETIYELSCGHLTKYISRYIAPLSRPEIVTDIVLRSFALSADSFNFEDLCNLRLTCSRFSKVLKMDLFKPFLITISCTNDDESNSTKFCTKGRNVFLLPEYNRAVRDSYNIDLALVRYRQHHETKRYISKKEFLKGRVGNLVGFCGKCGDYIPKHRTAYEGEMYDYCERCCISHTLACKLKLSKDWEIDENDLCYLDLPFCKKCLDCDDCKLKTSILEYREKLDADEEKRKIKGDTSVITSDNKKMRTK